MILREWFFSREQDNLCLLASYMQIITVIIIMNKSFIYTEKLISAFNIKTLV